jgi:mRNA-degrading endonuclease RelE of RelBE toxin-antitoxin system
MKYEVKIKKKALRGLEKLPVDVRKLLFLLMKTLKQMVRYKKIGTIFHPWVMITTTAI